MAQKPTKSFVTLPIDSTGELAHFKVTSPLDDVAPTVGLNLDGTDTASYAVDVGAKRDDGTFKWFSNEATYSSTTGFTDGWVQAEPYFRIRVTSAGASGSEATIYVGKEP